MSTIYITKTDRQKIIDLISKKGLHDDYDGALLLELGRAHIVEPQDIPGDAITMDSLVALSDMESQTRFEYWLVFPQDADVLQRKVSVLSPIGCALLGCRVGDLISIQTPKGNKLLKVERILQQPESLGNYE